MLENLPNAKRAEDFEALLPWNLKSGLTVGAYLRDDRHLAFSQPISITADASGHHSQAQALKTSRLSTDSLAIRWINRVAHGGDPPHLLGTLPVRFRSQSEFHASEEHQRKSCPGHVQGEQT